MLGLIDRAYTFRRIHKKPKKMNFEFDVSNDFLNQEVSIHFVPEAVSRSYFGNGIMDNRGISLIYTLKSREIIDSEPKKTTDNLRQIYEHCAKILKQFLLEGYRVNLIGTSLGNVLAIRFGAELANGNLKRLVAVAGGFRLGFSAWDSILTRDKVRLQCSSVEEYEREVSEFSPINYVQKITAEQIYFRMGSHDLLIPPSEGYMLARALQSQSSNLDSKVYRWADHGATIFLASRDLRRKNKV